MQMQILIAFTGCRDMARPSVLWPFGGMKLPFLCCAHCLFPILELTETKDFSLRPDVPFVLASLTVPVLQSPKRLSRQNRPFRPAARRGRIRVSPLRKQACLWVRAWSRFAPLFPKKGLLWGRPGVESAEIDFNTISSTYARLFTRTIPVRTPQSASRTENFYTACHGGW